MQHRSGLAQAPVPLRRWGQFQRDQGRSRSTQRGIFAPNRRGTRRVASAAQPLADTLGFAAALAQQQQTRAEVTSPPRTGGKGACCW